MTLRLWYADRRITLPQRSKWSEELHSYEGEWGRAYSSGDSAICSGKLLWKLIVYCIRDKGDQKLLFIRNYGFRND
jgi:hypothetical protein